MKTNKFEIYINKNDDKTYVVYAISNLSKNDQDEYGITNDLFDLLSGCGKTKREAIINYITNLNHFEELLFALRQKLVNALYDTIKEEKDERNKIN